MVAGLTPDQNVARCQITSLSCELAWRSNISI